MTEEQYKNLMFALSEIIYFIEQTNPFRTLTYQTFDESLKKGNQKRTDGTRKIYKRLTGETTDKEAIYLDEFSTPSESLRGKL